jgi:hypothetical protein
LKEDGMLMYKGKIYVSNSGELKNKVLREMHNVPYIGHPWMSKDNCSCKKPIIFYRNEEIIG